MPRKKTRLILAVWLAAGSPLGAQSPRSAPPPAWRALYVNAWAFGGARFDQLVRLADSTEINALVIDVKDDTLEDGQRRSAALGGIRTAEITPYLQAFTLGQPRYTPWHVREQIQAAEDLGIMSWVLWNPGLAVRSGDLPTRAGPIGGRRWGTT